MVEPPETMVPIKGEVVMADELPPAAPPAYIVVLPTVVVTTDEPEVTVETRAEVVIAEELPPAPIA